VVKTKNQEENKGEADSYKINNYIDASINSSLLHIPDSIYVTGDEYD
jgi:hypothetical protein